MRQQSPETYEEKLARLQELREQAIHTNPQAEEKQHAKGKLTAREWVEKLLDPGSFQELDTFVRHRTFDFDMLGNRPWGTVSIEPSGWGTMAAPPCRALRLLSGEGDTVDGSDVGYYKPMGEMYSDHTRILSLQAILEGAMRFGLTEDEAWRATDEALHDVGRDATISEYLEELTGALARHILYKQQDTPSQERRSGHEERHVPSEELF